MAYALGAHRKSFSTRYFARQQDNQLVLLGQIFIAKRISGGVGAGAPFDANYFKAAGIERNPVKLLHGSHPEAIYSFDPVV